MLQHQNLVIGSASIIMEVTDGTIIEVFEGKSRSAREQARISPAGLKLRKKYAEACEYTAGGTLR
jgi:hypothetical protein